jgi:hypothetical protein
VLDSDMGYSSGHGVKALVSIAGLPNPSWRVRDQ